MPYAEEYCMAGRTIEYSKYYCYRFNKYGESRSKRTERTKESQKKVNQRKALKVLRRRLNANFEDGDYLLTLDYRKEQKPDSSKEMQADMKKFIRKMGTSFKKQGIPFKYVYCKEVGPRGSRHIHMVMNKINLESIVKAWEHGGIHVDPLNTDGQYEKIAEYFIKYADRTEETEGELVGKRFYASRNLVIPVPKRRVINAKYFCESFRKKKGYYLDKNSVLSGISEITGYGYFSYTLRKLDDKVTGS